MGEKLQMDVAWKVCSDKSDQSSCSVSVGLWTELISLHAYACMIGVLACSRERSGFAAKRNMTFFPLNLASRLLKGPPIGRE